MVNDHNGKALGLQEWLRNEWKRTGLPFSKTNEACGVKNAATRKYFTPDRLWYFPPAQAMKMISDYAKFYMEMVRSFRVIKAIWKATCFVFNR